MAQDRRDSGVGEYSLLMLKGGGQGRLFGAVSSAVLRGLSRGGCFEVLLGSPHTVFMEGAIRRWDYLDDRIAGISDYYSRLETITGLSHSKLAHSRVLRDSLANLDYALHVMDHWRVHRWIDRLRSVKNELPAVPGIELSRVFAFTRYVLASSQYIMVKRCVPRDVVLDEWNITDVDLEIAVRRGVSKGVISQENADRGDPRSVTLQLDEQDFVKLVLVGSPGVSAGQDHSLRAAVRRVVHSKPAAWLEELAESDLSADDVASIANGVHGPFGPQSKGHELLNEISLIPLEDLERFASYMSGDLK